MVCLVLFLIGTHDAKRKLLMRDYIEAAQKHGVAWVSYYWPWPGTRNPVRKLTYVEKNRVSYEDLIIVAGIYGQ